MGDAGVCEYLISAPHKDLDHVLLSGGRAPRLLFFTYSSLYIFSPNAKVWQTHDSDPDHDQLTMALAFLPAVAPFNHHRDRPHPTPACPQLQHHIKVAKPLHYLTLLSIIFIIIITLCASCLHLSQICFSFI